ncbi:tyrosine-protein phosphatase [Rheinheimera oceanensis]|uniref:tyrosine-protein phosphatase n=1 Tax=Rheinheimera oceanensis TaxID=2817449 RepID=UPI001BFDDD01|nr:CpsB/CapC family capsule biosynthesis tyrosine phosphatase [Rheinheimera oceanensis]
MMFDLHNHILPGVDDGARDLAEALALLQLAQQQGISHMLATPHLHAGRYNNSAASITEAITALQQAVSDAGIAITLAAAAEVRIGAEILPLIEQQQMPFIGRYQGNKVLLLELPHSHIPAGSDKLLAWLARHDITVMLAHPERNRDFLAVPDKIKPFIKAGCLFQLTAAALDGDMGLDVKTLAQQWLKQGLYHVIASDAHSVKRRPPKLQLAYQHCCQLVGEDQARQLCVLNPAQLAGPVFSAGMLLN